MSLTNRKPLASLPNVAERVRLRNLYGATQTEVARHCGITRKTVYQWERRESVTACAERERYAELLASWAATENRLRAELKAGGE